MDESMSGALRSTSTEDKRSAPADPANPPVWDVIIVGAGPAGTSAAIHMASQNLRVLLVESKKFPRHKVCGGCLNGRSWFWLGQLGLEQRLLEAGAVSIDRFRLCCGDLEAHWPMQNMRAISRWTMDELLLEQAIRNGVTVLTETTARLGACTPNTRQVELHSNGLARSMVQAKLVVVATGVTSVAFSDLSQVESIVRPGTKIGVGTCLEVNSLDFPSHELRMIAGHQGYLGITQVEQGKINMAAAIDVQAMRSGYSIAEVLLHWIVNPSPTLREAMLNATWTGTPGLTRRSSSLGEERTLLIGDAAGYVEPFTGEGMSWAFEAGALVSPLAVQACLEWSPDIVQRWTKIYRQSIRNHQLECRTLAWLMKYPRWIRSAIRLSKAVPSLGEQVIRRITKPPRRTARSTELHRSFFARNVLL